MPNKSRRVEKMTTSPPQWRSVLASAATVAALVVAPLAGAGAAFADDGSYGYGNPYPPHPTHTPKPPYPPKPPHHHHNDHGHDEHGHDEHGHDEHGHDEHGHDIGQGGPEKPHLAHTGADNHTQEMVLGGVAAALIAAGAGTIVVARRRSNS
ncbi:LAETG motif-containing sortase-dependent surface protein [Streptomyces sp. NPDC003996]